MIGEDYPAEAYYKLLEDNREMQADLKTAMDMAEAISKRHAKLVEAARAVCDSHVPDYCGMLGIRVDELRTALDAEVSDE